jgi:hypothetical protein
MVRRNKSKTDTRMFRDIPNPTEKEKKLHKEQNKDQDK